MFIGADNASVNSLAVDILFEWKAQSLSATFKWKVELARCMPHCELGPCGHCGSMERRVPIQGVLQVPTFK
jgi:hypothetical protein